MHTVTIILFVVGLYALLGVSIWIAVTLASLDLPTASNRGTGRVSSERGAHEDAGSAEKVTASSLS